MPQTAWTRWANWILWRSGINLSSLVHRDKVVTLLVVLMRYDTFLIDRRNQSPKKKWQRRFRGTGNNSTHFLKLRTNGRNCKKMFDWILYLDAPTHGHLQIELTVPKLAQIAALLQRIWKVKRHNTRRFYHADNFKVSTATKRLKLKAAERMS